MSYYLIQRLSIQRWPGTKTGFDRHFALDYMGSSEFEWGAIPKALRSIRALGPLEARLFEIEQDGETASLYMVGAPATLAEKIDAFRQWTTDSRRPWFGKESTGLQAKLFGGADYHEDVVAWWAIEEDVALALNVRTADLLLHAFKPRAVGA